MAVEFPATNPNVPVVAQKLDYLDRVIKEHEVAFDDLVQRLQPALNPMGSPRPSADLESTDIEAPQSEISSRLENSIGRLENLTDGLRAVYHRLEI